MDSFSFRIARDEWEQIGSLVYSSCAPDEGTSLGQLQLQIEGNEHRWTAADGSQLATFTFPGSGAWSDGSTVPTATALINPRYLRGVPMQDCTVTVSAAEGADYRTVSIDFDGVQAVLPEHPDDFPDGKALLEEAEQLAGASGRIRLLELAKVLGLARVRPTGIPGDVFPQVALVIRDGVLLVQARWPELASTHVTAPLLSSDGEALVWVDPDRLWTLLAPDAGDDPGSEVEITLPADVNGPVLIRTGTRTGLVMSLDLLSGARGRLEELLREYLGVDELHRDDDGDYPVAWSDDDVLFIRLTNPELPTVVVFAVIASGVDSSPELLAELNSINVAETQVKAVLVGGAILAEVEIVATALDPEELGLALQRVRDAMDRYHPLLEGFFAAPDPDG